MTWRALDHTADVALEVRAESLDALFAEAARAFGELVGGGPAPAGVERTERALELTGADRVECWVRFWRECLRLFAVEGELPVGARVAAGADGRSVRARVDCIPAAALDPARCTDVKAVTWHAADASERAGTWTGTIVLDL